MYCHLVKLHHLLQSDLLELKGATFAELGGVRPGFNRTCWN